MVQNVSFNKHNSQIDGLRGLGTVMICVFHLFYRYQQIFCDGKYAIEWMSCWGTIGVNIFMLITCWYFIDFENKLEKFDIIRYAVNRIIRLWPCYVIAITVTEIVIHIAYLPNRMSSWTDWFLNIFFINGFIGTPYVDGAHWYLTTLISLTVVTALLKKVRMDKNPLSYVLLNGVIVLSAWIRIPVLPSLIGGGYIGILSVVVSLKRLSGKNKDLSISCKIAWGGGNNNWICRCCL